MKFNINLTWKKLIIFSIIIGIYTGIIALIPFLKDTSFKDISISFEWWILFGILIILNSKSNKDSALKCFVFFLISQPLVYLVQVPFVEEGFNIFRYYNTWFIWTLLTLPMGYIGYFLKKDKWWGLVILIPILLFLGSHYYNFLNSVIMYFPNHLISMIFCLLCIIILPIYIFKNKRIKYIGLIISILIIIVSTFFSIFNKKEFYTTPIIYSDNEYGIKFNKEYKAYFEDEKYGNLYIEPYEDIYTIQAEFKKIGETKIIIEYPNKLKKEFKIKIGRNSYELNLIK